MDEARKNAILDLTWGFPVAKRGDEKQCGGVVENNKNYCRFLIVD